jgi:peroxiredoxin
MIYCCSNQTDRFGALMKWTYALLACCLLLLGINLALLYQNRALKAQLSAPPSGLEAEPGAPVPDLKGYDISGNPLTISYAQDSRKVLVFVFSPTCSFCVENWPKWWDVMPALNRQAVRPVAVDVTASSTQAFLAEHRLTDMPVMLQVDPVSRVRYRLQITPQTILVDTAGRIEKVWSGVLDDAALADLKKRVTENKTVSRNSSSF